MKQKILTTAQSILCGSAAVLLVFFLFILGLLNPIWGEINAGLPGNFNFMLAGIIVSVIFLLWMIWILVWSLIWRSPVTSWWNTLAGVLVIIFWSMMITTLLRETSFTVPSIYPQVTFNIYLAGFLILAGLIFVVIFRTSKTIPSLVISGLCLIGALTLGYFAIQANIADQNRWQQVSAGDFSTWQAQWIGPKTGLFAAKPGPNSWWMYRKTFTVEHLPEGAPARIAVDTHYWLWINGQLVIREGGLKRGPNPYDTYYDSVDLAPYLSYGENSIAILVWYFGKDGFSHNDSGKTGLLFDLQTPKLTVLSDSTWKVRQNPAYYSTEDPQPNYRLAESNVGVDGRLVVEGWQKPKFLDKTWDAAVELGKAPAAPWNNLVERPIPFWQDGELTDYVSVQTETDRLGNQTVRAILPGNLQVYPYIQVKSEKNMIIDIRTNLYQDGGANSVRAEYITAEGEQEFEAPGWMNGQTVIYKLPAGVEILSVRYRSTSYNSQATGSVLTDDLFLNKLYEKSLASLTVNMRDTFMDCPDRERAQWWADEVIELQSAGYALDSDALLLARKGILELAGWQQEDGVLFSPIPSGNWHQELPQQMLQAVYGIRQYAYLTGDVETIRTVYPAVQRYLALWHIGPDGLVVHRTGGWDWSDWGERIDQPVLENAWYYLALKSQYDLAGMLGLATDRQDLSVRMDDLAAAFRKAYRSPEGFKSPEFNSPVDDRAQAVAVISGLAEKEDYSAILTSLQNTYQASPLYENYVIQALYEMDEAQSALTRIRTRYADQINAETPTLWETWQTAETSTTSHAWGGGSLYLLPAYSAGIRPLVPGYRVFLVAPQPGGLGRVGVTVPTPYGPIEEHFQQDGATIHIRLVAPSGTSAWVALDRDLIPDPEKITISLNGQPTYVTLARTDERYFYYPVSSGEWLFQYDALAK